MSAEDRSTPSPDAESTLVVPSVTEKAGDKIGRYKLREKIGEGGWGAVYVAEQEQPVRRRVALKIIKPGLDTRQVIARFEAERQALAMMDHPNIGKVLDAGTTDAGRPYFVMELVRGVPITQYCDQQQLTPRQRLELFIQVCQAVQHAHQKGIIHRDLKPSNVLITLQDGDKPTPKVIDFGIAKATVGQRLTDLTLFTEFKQLIGTPLYMSPEQAVEACPPSRLYRLKKFARRNKAVLVTAAVVVMVFVAASVVSTWEALRAQRATAIAVREADHARSEADKQRAVNDFLNTMLR